MTAAPFTGEPDYTLNRGWYPVAASADVVPGHVAAGRLWGSDLVIWRDDNGSVNVWPDRCLHRGVRLSIGSNTGSELVCRYHGWRYATVAGSCTYIPAHPDNAPPQSLCTAILPVHEHAGLVWTSLDGAPGSGGAATPPEPFPGGGGGTDDGRPTATPLWAMTVDVGVSKLASAVDDLRSELAALVSAGIGPAVDVELVLQPVDPGVTVVRPLAVGRDAPSIDPSTADAAAEMLLAFARRIESTDRRPNGGDGRSTRGFGQVAALGRVAGAGLIEVEVKAKWLTAEDIMAFEFAPVQGTPPLPAPQPGAHIDVHAAEGLLRPYSLTNGPGDTVYRIGVKREPESRGGSVAMHDSVGVGDRLSISHPRNLFPLRRDADETVLVAGGIGVTPLLAMAQTLADIDAAFELHYFVRSPDHVAFAELLETLGSRVVVHEGLDPMATQEALDSLLAEPGFGRQVYACGPPAMLDAVRSTARSFGWPDDAVHVEFFQNPHAVDLDSTFEIALSRSARTLTVSAGETILDVLRANGISVEASCEQGACGTCVVPLLDGRADHQDVYLSDARKAVQDRIAVCVSRAETERLVLEL